MRKISLFILSATLAAALMTALYISSPRQFHDNGVSDEEYIAIVRNTDEARALLEIYPQAEILVYRSGRLIQYLEQYAETQSCP